MAAITRLPLSKAHPRTWTILFHVVFGGIKLFVELISPRCILKALLAMTSPVVGDRV
jgi:hypothetical protein